MRSTQETNTIFAGTPDGDGEFVSTETDGVIGGANALYVVSYDSNDRFNIDPDGDGAMTSAACYLRRIRASAVEG